VPESNLQSRVDAVKELVKLFRFERIFYISVTLISLVVLLGAAASLLTSGDEASTVEAIGLFGASGALTYTTGRLLRMWSDSMRALGLSEGD